MSSFPFVVLCAEADLSLKESLGKTFLDVASKVLPGISRLKVKRSARTQHLFFGIGMIYRMFFFYVKGTALYELFLTLKQRAILALGELGKVDHSQEVNNFPNQTIL
jgi:hypothetical protein